MSELALFFIFIGQLVTILCVLRMTGRMDTVVKIANDARRIANHTSGQIANLFGIVKKVGTKP